YKRDQVKGDQLRAARSKSLMDFLAPAARTGSITKWAAHRDSAKDTFTPTDDWVDHSVLESVYAKLDPTTPWQQVYRTYVGRLSQANTRDTESWQDCQMSRTTEGWLPEHEYGYKKLAFQYLIGRIRKTYYDSELPEIKKGFLHDHDRLLTDHNFAPLVGRWTSKLHKTFNLVVDPSMVVSGSGVAYKTSATMRLGFNEPDQRDAAGRSLCGVLHAHAVSTYERPAAAVGKLTFQEKKMEGKYLTANSELCSFVCALVQVDMDDFVDALGIRKSERLKDLDNAAHFLQCEEGSTAAPIIDERLATDSGSPQLDKARHIVACDAAVLVFLATIDETARENLGVGRHLGAVDRVKDVVFVAKGAELVMLAFTPPVTVDVACGLTMVARVGQSEREVIVRGSKRITSAG
ncbi:hypothetical protein JCM3770_002400, partial [Rhodotorula araucariae]